MTLAKEVAGVLIDDLAQGGSPSAASAQQGETGDGNQVALEDCVGSYRLESTGKVLEVVLQDSLLLVKNLAKSGELLALSPGPGSQFTVKGVGLKLSFDRGSEGVAERLTLHVGDPPQIATRVSLIQLRPEQLAILEQAVCRILLGEVEEVVVRKRGPHLRVESKTNDRVQSI